MGGSSGSSKPRDLTPEEFKALRGPLSGVLRGVLAGGGLPQFEGPFTAALGDTETDILAGLDATTSAGTAATGTAIDTLTSQAGAPANPFAGFAALSPEEQTALFQVFQSGVGTSGLQEQGRDLLGRTIAGDFLDPASNPFLRGTIDAATRPIFDLLQDQTLNNRSAFTAAGQFVQPEASSPFDTAQARLSVGGARAVGDVASNISFANFQQERDRQVAAGVFAEAIQAGDFDRASQAFDVLAGPRRESLATFETSADRAQSAATAIPQVTQAQVDTIISNLEAQALPRLIEQFGIDRGLEEFRRQAASLLEVLGITAGVASPTIASEVKQKGASPFLGAAATAAGTAVGGPLGGAAAGVATEAIFGP